MPRITHSDGAAYTAPGGYKTNATIGLEKTRLQPNIVYGDGRPWDPGTDREMAIALNNYHDYRSAYQCPQLRSTTAGSNSDWTVDLLGVYFFGLDAPGATVTRSLTVAPFFRSSNGASADVRVTLSRMMPTPSPSELADAFEFADFGLHYSQSSTWNTSSTTWQTGATATLDISVKDLFWGMAWLSIETQNAAQVRGLAVCYEGPRVLV